ncbi:glutaredoxin family protein [Nostoc sp.]|uniref:glutaredoxin family protein n=1 Tax=Nostoc sp. TaxID=1180 RepID=UPI002FF585C0
MRLLLYSKPGCHLCEGLQEKLEQIQNLSFELEIRDITTREDWFAAYQYEVPVLYLSNRQDAEEDTCVRGFPPVEQSVRDAEGSEKLLPRPSPRASVQQLEQMLRKYLAN